MQHQTENGKNLTNAKEHPGDKLFYLKIIHILHPRYHPNIIENILKISKRASFSVFLRLYN